MNNLGRVDAGGISAALDNLRKSATLSSVGENSFPLVISPKEKTQSAYDWAGQNSNSIDSLLNHYGAILFRGFDVQSVLEFERFVSGFVSELHGSYGDLPKRKGTTNIYKSTPYPKDKKILFHNESSHLPEWPHKQCFYCEIPSVSGGATPIVDCREVYRRIPHDLIQEFEHKGLLYVRTFHGGMDVSWQEFFKTDSVQEVAQRCAEEGSELEFIDFDVLQIKTKSQATLRHSTTGEKSFFNQIQLHHSYSLEPELRAALKDQVGFDRMPRNVFYGDQTNIPDSAMALIGEIYESCAVRFAWEKNDVLLLDNMLIAHARDEFEGERRIAVAMGDMTSLQPA